MGHGRYLAAAQGTATFGALQGMCKSISPAVLNSRLKELREARLVVHVTGEGYALTDMGAELDRLSILSRGLGHYLGNGSCPEDAERWSELLAKDWRGPPGVYAPAPGLCPAVLPLPVIAAQP